MNPFVLDCSVTLAWCFEDETSAAAHAILESLETNEAFVPSIWPLEVANVLAISERKGRLTEADTARFISLLGTLPITVDDETSRHAFGAVLALARTHGLSAYDAAYLELAMRTGATLATFDDSLRKAATKVGVELVTD
jgi:predicted nucleic acid-binding protein